MDRLTKQPLQHRFKKPKKKKKKAFGPIASPFSAPNFQMPPTDAMLPLPSPSTADAGAGAGVPLLPSSDPPPTSEDELSASDPVLDDALRGLHLFLSLLGFHHSASHLAFFLSASAFLAIAVLAPSLALRLHPSKDRQVADFELYTLSSQASLAAASLLCVTHNLRKHGLRKFLFVDRFHGQATKFCEEYVAKLKVSPLRSFPSHSFLHGL